MTLEQIYNSMLSTNGDMSPNMPILRRYGELCPKVVEFGVRGGCSTASFLLGGANVESYDINPHTFDCPNDIAPKWRFHQNNTLTLHDIPECDLLFIDTAHTYAQVKSELRFHQKVKRFIGFHDTIIYGKVGDDNGLGINLAIFEFMCEHPEWRICEHHVDNWGMTMLEKRL